MLQRPHHQLAWLAIGLRDGAVDLAQVGEHQRRHRRRQQRAPGSAALGQHHIDVELGEQHRDRLLHIHHAGRDLPQPAHRPFVQVEIEGLLRLHQPQVVGEEGPEPIGREPLGPQVQHHLPPEALLAPGGHDRPGGGEIIRDGGQPLPALIAQLGEVIEDHQQSASVQQCPHQRQGRRQRPCLRPALLGEGFQAAAHPAEQRFLPLQVGLHQHGHHRTIREPALQGPAGDAQRQARLADAALAADQHQPVEAIQLPETLRRELRLEFVPHLHRQAQVMAALLHRGDGREALPNPALVLRHPGVEHPGPVLQRAEQPRTQRQHLLPADRNQHPLIGQAQQPVRPSPQHQPIGNQQRHQQTARGRGQRHVAEQGTQREIPRRARPGAAGRVGGAGWCGSWPAGLRQECWQGLSARRLRFCATHRDQGDQHAEATRQPHQISALRSGSTHLLPQLLIPILAGAGLTGNNPAGVYGVPAHLCHRWKPVYARGLPFLHAVTLLWSAS
jgi:hypothetical protein